MLFTIFIITLAILLYCKIVKPHFYWKDKGVSYVKGWPIMGNMGRHAFQLENLVDMLAKLYKAAEGKRYVGIYLFMEPALFVTDIELIKRITVKEFDTFPDHKPLSSPDVDPIGGRTLLSLTYQNGWHDMRSTLSPSFTSSKMKKMYILIEEVADQLITHLSKEDFQTLEVKDIFSRVTIDVIATTAFGLNSNSLNDPNDEFYIKGKSVADFSGIKALRFLVAPTALGKLLKIGFFDHKVSNFFKNIVSKTILHREQENITRYDMLHLLLEARKGRTEDDKDAPSQVDSGFALVEESDYGKSKKIKADLDDDNITAQVLLFFLAGFGGVSDALTHLVYELALNPDIQKRLHEEIKESVDEKGKISYEQLVKLKYLDCVLTESIRLRPAGLVLDRISVKPYTIEPELPGESPVHLPAGSLIWIPVWPIHQDPQYYPNPEKFDPERFNDENKHKIKPFTYLPFGLGPRNCIGARFALLELKLIVSKLVQNFEIVPVEKTMIPFKLDKTGFNMVPTAGIWLGFKKRVQGKY